MNARAQSRHGGQRQRPLPAPGRDGYLVTPSGMPPAEIRAADVVAMPLDGDAPSMRRAPAVVGVALPSRPLPGAAGRRRDRPHALAVRHDARLPRPRHPAVPLHGRDGGGPRHPLRRRTRRSARRRCRIARVAALAGRRACLLARHGMIAFGRDLAARSRWRSRSRRWPRSTGARWPSATRRACPTTRCACAAQFAITGSRGPRERCAAANARSAASDFARGAPACSGTMLSIRAAEPCGFADCQRHASAHISGIPRFALQPRSSRARVTSA